jgi:hypothetical protein
MVALPLAIYGRNHRLLLHARTMDLSTTGALLHGSLPLRIGTTVRVEIDRGSVRNPLSLLGQVVRSSEPSERRRQHGVAVRFIELNELDEAVLRSIIADAQG